jgi:hypothetical protein
MSPQYQQMIEAMILDGLSEGTLAAYLFFVHTLGRVRAFFGEEKTHLAAAEAAA